MHFLLDSLQHSNHVNFVQFNCKISLDIKVHRPAVLLMSKPTKAVRKTLLFIYVTVAYGKSLFWEGTAPAPTNAESKTKLNICRRRLALSVVFFM